MSEQKSQYLLLGGGEPATIGQAQPDIIQVSRADLLKEYGLVMARAQHLQRVLGLQPLPTGQQRRKVARDR